MFTCKQLIALIPKIYDTDRIIKILAEDGTEHTVHNDPTAPNAHKQKQKPNNPNYDPSKITAIFNPNIGEYGVVADVGPAFATRRQEAFNMFTMILQQNPALVDKIGDLMFRMSDAPMAKEIADRLALFLPPQAKGEQPPDPHLQQAQQIIVQQHQLNEKMDAELKQLQSQVMAAKLDKELDAYKAETQRYEAIGKLDPAVGQMIIRGLLQQGGFDVPVHDAVRDHQMFEAQTAAQNQALQAQMAAANQPAGGQGPRPSAAQPAQPGQPPAPPQQ
jgi:hypothetical protein